MQGFGVLILFGALLTLATYGIGERLAGPRLGALAALAVATSQGVFVFTHEYIFALPTAAFLSCAVYALIRSEGMLRWRWAVACGAAIGLMMLSRTMAVAFLPGLGVAILLPIVLNYRDRLKERLLNLGLLVVSAVLVAATWYWNNFRPVYDYLTEFGYGSQAKNFGESKPPSSPGSGSNSSPRRSSRATCWCRCPSSSSSASSPAGLPSCSGCWARRTARPRPCASSAATRWRSSSSPPPASGR